MQTQWKRYGKCTEDNDDPPVDQEAETGMFGEGGKEVDNDVRDGIANDD